MKNYQAVHFDMDGVIADTEPYHVAAEIAARQAYNFPVNKSDWKGFKGRTATDIFKYLINTYGDPQKHDPREMIAHKTDCFIELAKQDLSPIDGALDFIEWAKHKYKKIALVTSSNRRIQQFILSTFCITEYFDYITTGDDITLGKPNSEPYLRSLHGLGVDGAASLVVEDSASGIQSASAAGCDVLAIATSHPISELIAIVPPPTLAVDSFKTARRILKTGNDSTI